MKRILLILMALFMYLPAFTQLTADRHIRPFDNRYYVSSRYGDDTNNGRSESQAFASIDHLMAIIKSGDHIFLERGSYWQEAFEGGANLDDITIESYGSGRFPIIDGSDVVGTNWNKTGGYTNVYDYNYTIASGVNVDAYPVYEDGIALPLATSLANCDATPGTYWWVENTSTSITVYVHTTNSDNPDSNGSLYEATTRTTLHIGNNSSISDLWVKRSLDRGGGIVTYLDSDRSNIITENGTSHSEINAGGRIYGMTALESIRGPLGTTLFVSYEGDPENLTAEYVSCYAINQYESNIANYSAFYAHGSGSLQWQKVSYIDCGAFGVGNCTNVLADSIIVKDGSWQQVEAFGFGGSDTDETVYHDVSGNQIWITGTTNSSYLPTKGQFYNNGIFLDDASAQWCFRNSDSDTVDLQNNAFYTENRAIHRHDNIGTAVGLFRSNYNIYYGKPNSFYHFEVEVGEYEGDHNIYFVANYGSTAEISLREGASGYSTLKSWIAATGEDQNSVFLTAYQATNFWAGDPTKGDFRINPDAEVSYVDPVDATYNNGNDVIKTLVGEFPDGTKLTEAGIRPGFPVGWKELPMTKEKFYKTITE